MLTIKSKDILDNSGTPYKDMYIYGMYATYWSPRIVFLGHDNTTLRYLDHDEVNTFSIAELYRDALIDGERSCSQ